MASWTEELYEALRDEILNSPNADARKGPEGVIYFRCPEHEDNEPSAWLGKHMWGCHAEGFKRKLDNLAQILQVPLPSLDYTLEQYAEDKGFDVETLRSFGVGTGEVQGTRVLSTPYRGRDGAVLRDRFRNRTGKRWWDGYNGPIYLYGMDRLSGLPKGSPLILVEGESDCHAAWSEGINAIGVPGADTWKAEWKDYLVNFDIYVWQEPDQGGAAFIRKIAGSFPQAKVIKPEGVKDLHELWRTSDDFHGTLSRYMDDAYPIGTPEPPVHFDAAIGDTLVRLGNWLEEDIDAVPTMWDDWNAACRGAGGGVGLARGWYVVAAAKTGNGKSILGANLIASAVAQGERCAMVSLEMVQEEILVRSLAIHTNTPVRLLEKGPSLDREALQVAQAIMNDEFMRTGGVLFTNREPINTLDEVLDSMRFLYEVRGVTFFVVDYIQLVNVFGAAGLDKVNQVSGDIRKFTKQNRVNTVALSQFNRETSKKNERPTKEGLMGGSPLENDSDQVLLIDHSRTVLEGDEFLTYAILDKNRHGPLIDIPIRFSRKTLRMEQRIGEMTEGMEDE